MNPRYDLAPQMRDYDALKPHWVPYLMNFHQPRLRLSSVTTDDLGFRTTVPKEGGPFLSVQEMDEKEEGPPLAVLLGGSTAFGVGATADKHTVPSVLNQHTELRWLNFGGRALNSTQELLLAFFFLPRRVKKVVVFSGFNNLALSFLSPVSEQRFNPFFYQARFERSMDLDPERVVGVKESLLQVGREVKRHIQRLTRSQCPSVRLPDCSNAVRCFDRDMEILKGLSRLYGFDVYFVLQPVAEWVGKSLSPEERTIFEWLDHAPGMNWEGISRYINAQRDEYVRRVRKICSRHGVPFADMNACSDFSGGDWLFVDRVHLTDLGYWKAAQYIVREVSL